MIKLTELYSQYMYPSNINNDISSSEDDFDKKPMFNEELDMFYCFHAIKKDEKYVVPKEQLLLHDFEELIYTEEEFKLLEERIKQRFTNLDTFADYDQWAYYQGIQFNLTHNKNVYAYLKTLENIHVQDFLMFDLVQMEQHVGGYKNEAILYYLNIDASKLPLNVIYRAVLFDEYKELVEKYQEGIFYICYVWNISPTKVIDHVNYKGDNIFSVQKWLVNSLKPKLVNDLGFKSNQRVVEEYIIPKVKYTPEPKILKMPTLPALPSFKCEPVNVTLDDIKKAEPTSEFDSSLGYFDSSLPTSFKMHPVNLSIDEIKNIKPKFFQPSF